MIEKLIGEATAEQIAAWKQKYVQVWAYKIDGRVAYLRNVDRQAYSLALSKFTSNPAKFNEVIIENIWLGGDDELKRNDRYYFGLIDFVEDLMAKKKGSLQEL